MRALNPFNFGKIAEGKHFVNRVEDKKFVRQTLCSGQNLMLISPRRWGKSSLVKQALSEINDPAIKVCYIDAFTIHSSEEFYQVFAKEVIKSSGNTWKQWVSNAKSFIKSIVPKITLGSNPATEFSLQFDFKDIPQAATEILNLPERIAQSKHIKLIICIDEFQNLAHLQDYSKLESLMRSVWQHQQNVTYCLYGSQRHMMSEIFNSSQKPFYRFGQLLFLKKIEEKEWVRYIVTQFDETRKSITKKQAQTIAKTCKNHSWYVQQYASAVWNLTPFEKNVSDKILDAALKWLIDLNLPNFQTEYMSVNVYQIRLLEAIASGEKQLTSEAVREKYMLGSSANVIKNKKILINRDFVDNLSPNLDFLDPIFEIWFKRINFIP